MFLLYTTFPPFLIIHLLPLFQPGGGDGKRKVSVPAPSACTRTWSLAWACCLPTLACWVPTLPSFPTVHVSDSCCPSQCPCRWEKERTSASPFHTVSGLEEWHIVSFSLRGKGRRRERPRGCCYHTASASLYLSLVATTHFLLLSCGWELGGR